MRQIRRGKAGLVPKQAGLRKAKLRLTAAGALQ